MVFSPVPELARPMSRARHWSMLLSLALAAACSTGPLDDSATDQSPDLAVTTVDTLTLSPATINLAPGGKGRFRVRTTTTGVKVATSYISWAATGGTISPRDSNIVYWAGPTPGSYEVSATIGGKKMTASVTIGDGSSLPSGSGDTSGTATGGGTDTGTGGTTPPPPPPPSGETCLNQSGPLVVLTGSQGKYDTRSSMPANTKFDARQASWVGAGTFPVEFGNTNAPGMCWSGGLIQGTWTDGTPWLTYHSTAAMFVASPGFVVEDATIANYGDGLRVENYTDNWTIRRTHMIDAHDDCVENDRLYSGVLDDDLFEGCYVFLSERPGGGVTIPVSGVGKTVKIQNSLVWHKPMPTVYKGTAPGTGPLFKWDNTGTWTGTSVVITNTILRVDQRPSHGDLKLPPTMGACSGNTMVWLGGGAYPEPLPSCFTVTTDKGVWDRAVADWKARHPGN
jgi:hypothetical protein